MGTDTADLWELEAAERAERAERSSRDILWSFVFSYGLAFVLLSLLIAAADFWTVLGYTRIFDFFVRAGVVQLHDGQLGLIGGRQDLGAYYAAQDPVDWVLVAFAGFVLFVAWLVKAFQFHRIAGFCGMEGSIGQNFRAYFYGRGLNMFMPFNLGKVGTVAALEGQGKSTSQAAMAVLLAELFIVFEIIVFAILHLIDVGWSDWWLRLFWAMVLVGAAYLITHHRLRPSRMASDDGLLSSARAALGGLYTEPLTALKLAILSIVSFVLNVAVIYMISQAFTGPNVVLLVEPPIIAIGLVGGYLASLIRITPGAIGQFELGFALALMLSGISLAGTTAIVFLFLLLRYFVGGIIFGIVNLGYGVETDLKQVLRRFTGEKHSSGDRAVSTYP